MEDEAPYSRSLTENKPVGPPDTVQSQSLSEESLELEEAEEDSCFFFF